MSELREACGVFGVLGNPAGGAGTVIDYTYRGLYSLQHRGQESCGIAVNNGREIICHKDTGLLSEVFTARVLSSLSAWIRDGDEGAETGQDADADAGAFAGATAGATALDGAAGFIAIGHTRYGTTGANNRINAQPLTVNHIKGCLAVAHNGNLTNHAALRSELELSGSIFQTTSDTEVISYIITRERLTRPSIEDAIQAAMSRLEGAYSLVVMSPRKLMAVRDAHGFRPLCIGEKDGCIIFASESCALDGLGARFIRDVAPGEIVVAEFDDAGNAVMRSIAALPPRRHAHCVFEYIYFSRPDSVLDGVSVHRARVRAGEFLAQAHPVEADVVIGVPDSGLDAALGYAAKSGIPYGMGFIKNKYIGRTFIAPGQKSREELVRIKLNPIRATIEGKRVVLIDDSIVRGTTSRRIVQTLRDAGAREVHMRVSAPPFIYPCFYGTDVATSDQLVAARHTTEEIARLIGVDTLGYLSLARLWELPDHDIGGLCDACFTRRPPGSTPV